MRISVLLLFLIVTSLVLPACGTTATITTAQTKSEIPKRGKTIKLKPAPIMVFQPLPVKWAVVNGTEGEPYLCVTTDHYKNIAIHSHNMFHIMRQLHAQVLFWENAVDNVIEIDLAHQKRNRDGTE